MTEQQYGRRAVEVGDTGKTVADNLVRLRKARGYSIRQLSAALDRAGRSISPSGITRMEKADRHVTADDLTALAVVFRVNPAALLLPLDDSPEGSISITGGGTVSAADAWAWMDGERPLHLDESRSSTDMLDFDLYARPPRRRRSQKAPMPLTPEVMQYVQELAKEGRSGLVGRTPGPNDVEESDG